jgi:DNA-binding response OmpR family regulator
MAIFGLTPRKLEGSAATNPSLRSYHKPPSHPSCSKTGMSKRRILIVDDDVNLSRLAGMILENSGQYETMIVNESVRALPAALQFRPDAMLLDVDMPGKDGGDLAQEAAMDSRLRDIPILFLTGLVSHVEGGTGGLESGGMQFLSKPVDPALLLAAIGRLASPVVVA